MPSACCYLAERVASGDGSLRGTGCSRAYRCIGVSVVYRQGSIERLTGILGVRSVVSETQRASAGVVGRRSQASRGLAGGRRRGHIRYGVFIILDGSGRVVVILRDIECIRAVTKSCLMSCACCHSADCVSAGNGSLGASGRCLAYRATGGYVVYCYGSREHLSGILGVRQVVIDRQSARTDNRR